MSEDRDSQSDQVAIALGKDAKCRATKASATIRARHNSTSTNRIPRDLTDSLLRHQVKGARLDICMSKPSSAATIGNRTCLILDR